MCRAVEAAAVTLARFFQSPVYSTRRSSATACGLELPSIQTLPGLGLLSELGRAPLADESFVDNRAGQSEYRIRVNDWLSVGAGFSFSVARFKTHAKINNILPKFGDGGLSIESWDEAFGGNIGFLPRPAPKLRIGLTYDSPVDFKFGFGQANWLGPFLKHGGVAR
jgi:hypothetical protein